MAARHLCSRKRGFIVIANVMAATVSAAGCVRVLAQEEVAPGDVFVLACVVAHHARPEIKQHAFFLRIRRGPGDRAVAASAMNCG